MQQLRAARTAVGVGLLAGLGGSLAGPAVAVTAALLLAMGAWQIHRHAPELRRLYTLWQRQRTVARSQRLNRTAAQQTSATVAAPQRRAA